MILALINRTLNPSAFVEEYSELTTKNQNKPETLSHTFTATKNNTSVLALVGVGANSPYQPTFSTDGIILSDGAIVKPSNGGSCGIAFAILNDGQSLTASGSYGAYGRIYMKFWVA